MLGKGSVARMSDGGLATFVDEFFVQTYFELFYRPRTLNYFRGPGAPRGRFNKWTLNFAFNLVTKLKRPKCAY